MNHSATNHTADTAHYSVRGGGQEATVQGRTRAVLRAKAISRQRPGAVRVEREAAKESILYKGGSLQTYRLETR